MFSLTEMISFLPALLEGAYLTITVSLLSFALATVIGLLVGIARISRLLPLRMLATPYVQSSAARRFCCSSSSSTTYCPMAGSS